MLCPSLTLTATAVRRAADVCQAALASTGARLAIGLGVWSEPQGYALRVFYNRRPQQRGLSADPSSNYHETERLTAVTFDIPIVFLCNYYYYLPKINAPGLLC